MCFCVKYFDKFKLYFDVWHEKIAHLKIILSLFIIFFLMRLKSYLKSVEK